VSAATDAELEALEDELADAVRARDRATAERLLDPDFALTSALGTGLHIPRDGWLEGLAVIETSALAVRDRQARVFEDTAVVVFRMDWSAELGEDDLSGPYLVTDVWRRDRGGAWRLAWRTWARLNATFLLEELCAA
jgi:glycine/D-amino acid oxidase-like deaminating enzyme